MRILLFICLILTAAYAMATKHESSKHSRFDVGCESCHSGDVYVKPSMTVCTECHGGFGELAPSTKKYGKYNPHAPHEPYADEMECTDCHAMHRASGNFCMACHSDAEFSVP